VSRRDVRDNGDHRYRQVAVRVAAVFGFAVVGALVGLGIGIATPAHADVASNHVSLRLMPGRTYDQVDLDGALTGRRATSREILGEPIGVHADVNLDVSYLLGPGGKFNPKVLPAYLQAFSDPEQLVSDLGRALLQHLVWYAGIGAAVGGLAAVAAEMYRSWRHGYDRELADPDARTTSFAYHAPERRFVRLVIIGLVIVAALDATPGAARHQPVPKPIRPDPILADTPLAGTQLSGLLRPAISAVESTLHTYFADTNRYYADLRDRLNDFLALQPVQLPAGDGIVQFGFVTDRHCNIGMDRVIVDLLRHFDIPTLVSGGDDDFSGTFPFESACTSDLAEKSKRAGITDVFVAGNHDSAQTLADEHKQHIKILDGKVVTVGGLHFLGDPDPRSSRYGQGIQPSSPANQYEVLATQAARIGNAACAQQDTVILVLHDPQAGRQALESGCGRAVLALDGHTHVQTGPDDIPLPDGTIGQRFVGASTGGAPNEHSVERSFASALTVGPLHHDATVNLVSFDTSTQRLAGITVFRFTAEQEITVEQLPG
jgi:hypothetical protein